MAFYFRVHSRFDFGPDSFDKYKAPIRYLEVASTSMSLLEIHAGFLSIVYEGKM